MKRPTARTVLLSLAAISLLSCASVPAQALTATEQKIVAQIDAELPAAIELLARAVDIPSATGNLPGVGRVGELFAAEFERIGMTTSWAEMPPEMRRAGHLIAEQHGTEGTRLLLIGHLDTVLEEERWSRQGMRATGAGTNDMKGGNVVVLYALRALHAAGALEGRRISVIFTGDEEDVGDPKEIARRPLVELARRSDVALGFETGVGNTAVVARRGVTTWRLETTGVTGHSSVIFGERLGSGAIYEAGRILTSFHDTLREEFLTFNASVIAGGTTAELDPVTKEGRSWGKNNVVPETVFVEGDLRFITNQQRESAKARMEEIVARNLPQTSAVITFKEEYPSMAPTAGNYALLSQLDQVSRDLGFGEVTAFDPGARGAADISFVADYVDALDGLGAMGGRAHAPGEYVELDTLDRQIKRAALLIYRLTRQDPAR
jgi:glutamate carboxypeptidase